MSIKTRGAGDGGVMFATGIALLTFVCATGGMATAADQHEAFSKDIRPLVQQYCMGCHSTEKHKGSLDLERFTTLAHIRRDMKPWVQMIEMVESEEMPPEGKKQPTAEERKKMVGWVRGFLDEEARTHAGDPGFVPLRRLSNAEYNYTIRDLTGVDLQPTREFPADGAAGEGFTNAAEALVDMSPTLLDKYMAAGKDVAAHAVFLPDGFRFSATKSQSDWTNEIHNDLRTFYGEFAGDGKLPIAQYLTATVRYREKLTSKEMTLEAVAAKEKLNAKYLGILWATLNDKTPSVPLDGIREHWRQASEKDVAGLVAEISGWQERLWKMVKIGSYINGDTRQVANDPTGVDTAPLEVSLKPDAGQSEVVIHLTSKMLAGTGQGGTVIWRKLRMEGANKPTLLLKDYADFGAAYELDYPSIFTNSSKYLSATVELANDAKLSADEVAKQRGLDGELLKRWVTLLAIQPVTPQAVAEATNEKWTPAFPLKMLEDQAAKNEKTPAIKGWKRKGGDLPVVVSNASDQTEKVPGTMGPHKVCVHPTPGDFVAVSWKSPVEGKVRIGGKIAHVHPSCGNGVEWWVEHRRGDQGAMLAGSVIDLGGEAVIKPQVITVAKGDSLVVAVDAWNGDHTCDLTEINFTIAEEDKAGKTWDLAADIADNILDGNPHADKAGNKDVWSFMEGPSKSSKNTKAGKAMIAADSVLGQWREAAKNPARKADAEKLASQAQTLFSGTQPTDDKSASRVLYDSIVSPESVLLKGLDVRKLAKAHGDGHFGLEKNRFGQKPADDASVAAAAGEMVELRLPAPMFQDRHFVVDGAVAAEGGDRVVQFQVQLAGRPGASWDRKSSDVAANSSESLKKLVAGFTAFRETFPVFICFPKIIPDDEVVCLKRYHREDEPLIRLFLSDAQKQRLERLWDEHRFITHWPVEENTYLPLFIGFTTQDAPKDVQKYFEAKREPFRLRAEAFEKELEGAIPKQMEALLRFAAQAFRRPLEDHERNDLVTLYQSLRTKEMTSDDAIRNVLARILVSPSFLFRIEKPPAGKMAGAISDWELATRLSYFLWSTAPDDELLKVAASGKLHELEVLSEQARRMLKDARVRALAIEFGTQWIHVRGFDEFNEKNEKLFPTFDEKLRSAMYEESILFFQDLFQNDQPVARLLDADYTYLNEALAKHYGIPGVTGPAWRKVDGVQKFGRGGILGLGSVQSKQAAASRTSPVLRGNWVVETLLGEKLPRPPANVPKLPEEESSAGMTTRQMVEKHTSDASCMVCHTRIDPIGFTFERYDAIGRLREKEASGMPIDCKGKLKDGTQLEGIDGLRNYLLTKKKDVVVRLFCQRLLGYGLGRSAMLTDQTTIDKMAGQLKSPEGRLSNAVLLIVQSPQFRSIRGSDYTDDE